MSGAIFFGFEPFSPSPVKGWLRNDVFTNHCCHSSEKPWYGNIYTPTSPGRKPEVFFVASVAVHFGRGNRFFSIHPFLCNLFQTSVSRTGLSEVKGKGSEKKGESCTPTSKPTYCWVSGIKSTLQPFFIYPSRLAGWRFPPSWSMGNTNLLSCWVFHCRRVF